jgi:hypothetical protein
VKGDVEGRHGIPLRGIKDFGILTKVACKYALVEHDEILLSERIFEIQEYP